MIGAGVGRSGSPMPRLMISTPSRDRGLLHLVDGGKQIGRKRFNSGCDFNWKTGHGAEMLLF